MCRSLRCPECLFVKGRGEGDRLPNDQEPRRVECYSVGTDYCTENNTWSERKDNISCLVCREKRRLANRRESAAKSRAKKADDPESKKAHREYTRQWRENERAKEMDPEHLSKKLKKAEKASDLTAKWQGKSEYNRNWNAQKRKKDKESAQGPAEERDNRLPMSFVLNEPSHTPGPPSRPYQQSLAYDAPYSPSQTTDLGGQQPPARPHQQTPGSHASSNPPQTTGFGWQNPAYPSGYPAFDPRPSANSLLWSMDQGVPSDVLDPYGQGRRRNPDEQSGESRVPYDDRGLSHSMQATHLGTRTSNDPGMIQQGYNDLDPTPPYSALPSQQVHHYSSRPAQGSERREDDKSKESKPKRKPKGK